MATKTPAQSYVYVMFIRTTPQKLWKALTTPEFQRQYWGGCHQECQWTVGSQWNLWSSSGELYDSGTIVACDPPKRLVIRWQNEWDKKLKAEGPTRCTYLIEKQDAGYVKLTVRHEAGHPHRLIDAVSGGWPLVLSSLKTLLETGKAMRLPMH